MIALIDCNNFYCSCERLFQPALAGRAMLVLSNNDGCAISRSDEAKALGIKMGTPHFMIGEQIRKDNVAVHSSNYTLYGDISARVMQVISDLVPRTEVYSIDELFADLSDMPYADLAELAKSIRASVLTATGIPVSVGMAPTKTLAKMANRFAKKNRPEEGVFMADGTEVIHQLLQSTPVGEIWGIGPEHAKLLQENGFKSAADFMGAPEDWVRKQLSVVGLRTLHELKGIRAIPWAETAPPRKNITTARSFGKLVTSKKELRQAVARFTTNCAEKLRRENSCARKMQVFIQTNIHRYQDRQYYQSVDLQLHVPTNSTPELLRYSMSGLELIFQPGYLYQKAGVLLLDLVPSTQVQLGLFDTADREREKQLMKTVDEVNKSFGRDMVRFGVQDYEETWKLRQEHISQKFTTRLDQLPKAG